MDRNVPNPLLGQSFYKVARAHSRQFKNPGPEKEESSSHSTCSPPSTLLPTPPGTGRILCTGRFLFKPSRQRPTHTPVSPSLLPQPPFDHPLGRGQCKPCLQAWSVRAGQPRLESARMRPRKGLGSGWSSSPVGRTRGGRRSYSLCSRASHTCVHVDQETPHLLKKKQNRNTPRGRSCCWPQTTLGVARDWSARPRSKGGWTLYKLYAVFFTT